MPVRGFESRRKNEAWPAAALTSVRVRMRVKSKALPSVLGELAKFLPVFDIVSKSLPVNVAVETY